MLLYMTLTL